MKIVRSLSLLFLLAGILNAQVFISEYIEGSSNNKAIEIYNAGSLSSAFLDLSNYRLVRANNGGVVSDSLVLSGTLAAGDVYVLANSSAVAEIMDVADGTSTITYYNGDDYVALEELQGGNWVTIDVIGILGEDPGSGWDVAGVSSATGEHTLVRKGTVTAGNTDWAASAGTDTDNSEWIVYDQNTFDYLGAHPGMPVSGGEEYTAISEIQTTTDGEEGDSPLLDQTVMVKGIITAVGSSGYFVQDDEGPWSGVYVYDGESADTMAVGYEVSFSATVVEYNGLTELTEVTDDSVITTDASLPEPIEVATGDLNQEMYEGVLVTTFGVCDSIDTEHSEWAVNDGSGKAVVDNFIGTYTPTLGAYYSVTGPVNYNFNTYKVAIRNTDDVAEVDYVSIHEIQTPASGSGNDVSPYNGQTVVTSGIVTGIGGSGFFIQAGDDAYSGLYIYGSTSAKVGDSLIVVGPISEYYNLTELTLQKEVVADSNLMLPDPIVLTTGAIGDEQYEGVLVTTVGTCTDSALGHGEWELNDGTGAIVIDEELLLLPDDSPFVPDSGVQYAVTGPLNYSFSNYKIAPRDTTIDIVALLEDPKAEPSAYPTDLAAVAAGTDITLTWVDASGEVLPDGYIIDAYTQGDAPVPDDGIAYPNDYDFSDGEGVAHVAYGVQTFIFSGLEEETEYSFVIYPYTNASVQRDYKTDGTAPVVNATTGKEAVAILSENFESGIGDFDTTSVTGENGWTYKSTGYGANSSTGFMEMNGYSSESNDEDWLISPAIDFSLYTEETLTFYAQTWYNNTNEVTLLYSENYDGTGDPNSFTWTELTFTYPEETGSWVMSTVDLSSFEGSSVYFAFKYVEQSTTGAWRIDDVELRGVPEELVDLAPIVKSVTRDVMVPTTEESVVVSAEVTDDNELTSVTLYYEIDGSMSMAAMANTEGDIYEGTIPNSYTDESVVAYAVVATDNMAQSDTSANAAFLAGTSSLETAKTPDEDVNALYKGLYMRVTGTVTGIFSSSRTEFYMQDATAGIMIYARGFAAEVAEGDSITVVGKMAPYNGLMEITPDSASHIISNGSVGVPEPKLITISSLLDSAEVYEGMLLTIESVAKVSSEEWSFSTSSSGKNLDFYDVTDTIEVRIDADTDIYEAEEPSWPANLTGVLGQYDGSAPYTSGYQLLPRSIDDFDEPTDVEDDDALVTEYALSQNYPNPFNPTTTIKFSIKEAGMVTVKVYNILGQEVRTLVHDQLSVGNHTINFDASNLSSGVYLYNIQAGDFHQTKKMILLK